MAITKLTSLSFTDDSVVAAAIADNAVVTAAINADAVTAAKIADNAVVTAAINADAVTAAKIADDAVTAPRIADGAILRSKIEQPELVTNPNFTSNLSGWTDNSGSGSNIAHSSDFGGCMLMSGATAYAKADQQIATVVGVAYTLSVTVDDLTATNHNVNVMLGTSSGGTQIQNVAIKEGYTEFRFIATSTATFIRIQTGYNSVKVGSVSCRREASAGRILQVVQVDKRDVFTTQSTSFVDITGLTVNITPASSSNKILIFSTVNGSQDYNANRTYLKLFRDSTAIFIGDAAGNRIRGTGGFSTAHFSIVSTPVVATYLDSPSTTSQVTYKWQIASAAGSGTCFVNRSDQDNDETGQMRTASNILVMEVAG